MYQDAAKRAANRIVPDAPSATISNQTRQRVSAVVPLLRDGARVKPRFEQTVSSLVAGLNGVTLMIPATLKSATRIAEKSVLNHKGPFAHFGIGIGIGIVVVRDTIMRLSPLRSHTLDTIVSSLAFGLYPCSALTFSFTSYACLLLLLLLVHDCNQHPTVRIQFSTSCGRCVSART